MYLFLHVLLLLSVVRCYFLSKRLHAFMRPSEFCCGGHQSCHTLLLRCCHDIPPGSLFFQQPIESYVEPTYGCLSMSKCAMQAASPSKQGRSHLAHPVYAELVPGTVEVSSPSNFHQNNSTDLDLSSVVHQQLNFQLARFYHCKFARIHFSRAILVVVSRRSYYFAFSAYSHSLVDVCRVRTGRNQISHKFNAPVQVSLPTQQRLKAR